MMMMNIVILVVLVTITATTMVMANRPTVWGAGCPYSKTWCEHGKFNMSYCEKLQSYCPNDKPSSHKPDIIGWWQQQNCTCDKGWRGTKCQLAEPSESGLNRCPPSAPYFDGAVVNVNSPNKTMECFMDLTDDTFLFSLHHHRVDMQVALDKTGHGSIYFFFGSRHRIKASGPTHNYCNIIKPDIECWMSDCQGESYSSSQESAYECQKFQCQSCGNPLGHIFDFDCSLILGAETRNFKPPFKLKFKDVDISEGTSRMMFVTSAVALPFTCTTGQCVKEAINQNFQQTPKQKHAFIAYVLIGVCGGVAVMIFMFAGVACVPSIGLKEDEKALKADTIAQMNQGLREMPQFGIAFQGITYSVPQDTPCIQLCGGSFKRTRVGREILHGFDAVLAPCTMTGILGPSGAGKTTLLDIVSKRSKSGWVDGYVNYYSEHTNCRRAQDILSYVMQEDVLMSTQTVREALMFAGKMRLPPTFTHFMIKAKVEQLMEELCIDHIADSKVGSPNVGGAISGGERKRLAIGLELLTDPRVLVLDEPTSGLDSHSTKVVMNVLKRASRNGICVLMTIHQPPTEVFNMFDQVLVVTRNGKQGYLGPPRRSLDHMIRLGYSRGNHGVNPAEFLLDIVSQDDDDELDRISRNFMESEVMYRCREDIMNVRNRDHFDVDGSVSEEGVVPSAEGVVETDKLLVVRDPLSRRLSRGPTMRRDESISSIVGMLADHTHVSSDIDSLPRSSPPLSGNFNPDPAMTMSNGDGSGGGGVVILNGNGINGFGELSGPSSPFRGRSMEDDVNNRTDSSAGSPPPPAPVFNRVPSGGYGVYVYDAGDSLIPEFRRPQVWMGRKIVYLMIRQFRHIIRNPMLLWLQYSLTLAVAVLVGFLYWKLDNKIPGAQNRIGAFFFMIAFFTLMSLTSIGDLINERNLFDRERRNAYYSVLPYFVCKIFCDIIPLRVLPACGFSLVSYHMMGLQSDALIWAQFTMVVIMVNLVASSSSFLISSLNTDVSMANLTATLYFMFVLLYTGLFLNGDTTSSSRLSKINYVSFGHYAWEALVVNEFTGQLFIFNPTDADISPTTINGDVYIENFGLSMNSVVPNLYILVWFFLAKFVLTYVVVRFVPRDSYLVKIDFSCFSNSPAGFVMSAIGIRNNKRRASESVSGVANDDESVQKAKAPPEFVEDHPSLGLVFNQLRYTVGNREILRGVTGYARIGHLIGLLGPSGAGKSSLLDILAYRTKSGDVSGELSFMYEGAKRSKPGRLISYVPQHDVLMSTQTVREALWFSARMRLPPTTTKKEVNDRVEKALNDLCISHIADSYIGDAAEGGGISGGERKRVAIGIELVANPRVLLLDEPTSGLDSRSCQVVMNVLRGLTHSGCIVIVSIHQPPSSVYALFDHVMVLSRLGQQIFFGPPLRAPDFLRKAGYRMAWKWMNPAEAMLTVASSTNDGELNALTDTYFRSPLFDEVNKRINELDHAVMMGSHYQLTSRAIDNHTATGDSIAVDPRKPLESPKLLSVVSSSETNGEVGGDNDDTSEDEQPRLGCGYKTCYLMHRALTNLLRDPSLMLRQLVVTSAFAAVLGAIFWKVDKKIPGLQNRTGVLFFMCIYFALTAWSSLPVLIEGRVLFFRERASKVYGTLPYFVSKVLLDFVPLRVIPAILFALITYPMIGFRDPKHYFPQYVFLVVGVAVTSSAACFCFSALVNNIGQANLLATVFFSFNIVFGGLLLNNATATNHLMFLRWGAYIHYGFEALMVNEFHKQQGFHFNAKGALGKNGKIISGDVWLTNFGLVASHFYLDVFMLVAQLILFLVITFVALYYKRYVM